MKGIIFKQESINSILSGAKTMTRRVVTPQPMGRIAEVGIDGIETPMIISDTKSKFPIREDEFIKKFSPYSRSCYIKETHYISKSDNEDEKGLVLFPDGNIYKRCIPKPDSVEAAARNLTQFALGFKHQELSLVGDIGREVVTKRFLMDNPQWEKKSPLFMPEWLARYIVTPQEIKIEKLQDISFLDLMSEGLERKQVSGIDDGFMYKNYEDIRFWTHSPMISYKSLWNSINLKRGFTWESNPWVWAIKFSCTKLKNAEPC